MKFIYTGEAPLGSITMFGVTFTPGEASADVTDSRAIAKLTGNPFFEAVTEDKPKPAKLVKKAIEPA